MNGPQFLRELRDAKRDIPIIIVMGYPESDLMAEALRCRPFTLIAKPMEREQLAKAVRVPLSGTRDVR